MEIEERIAKEFKEINKSQELLTDHGNDWWRDIVGQFDIIFG